MTARIVLASASAARRAMLEAAGLAFDVRPADVDEEALKRPDADPAATALELAQAKALAASALAPGDWVIGADQTLEFDGGRVDKARSLDEARRRLTAMRGRRHQLHSGAALARDGRLVWSGLDSADLQMRDFSDAFLDDYLAREGEGLLACVGAYRLEGPGAQLFDRVDGDHFTVLGLPLWALLAALREAGAIAS